ncbi:MAG: hypothetical protein IMZ71_03105 [Chloroflexi bacterium]|nr:hypothetical protein [Chloroflexota bacterium]
MGDIFSKEWLGDLQKWGTTVLEKGVETLLFGKKAAAAGTADSSAGQVVSKATKWLPYALIGGALVVVLLVFKGKK